MVEESRSLREWQTEGGRVVVSGGVRLFRVVSRLWLRVVDEGFGIAADGGRAVAMHGGRSCEEEGYGWSVADGNRGGFG